MMWTYRCIRCMDFWSSQAQPGLYKWITKFCPGCLALLPVPEDWQRCDDG